MTDQNDGNATEAQQHRELMEFLTDNAQMRETARNALKQGLWAGSGAIAGGLLLGPIGGLVGGIGGSVIGFLRADEYNGVVQHFGRIAPTTAQSLGTVGGQGFGECWCISIGIDNTGCIPSPIGGICLASTYS